MLDGEVDGRSDGCVYWLIDWELKITSVKCYQNGRNSTCLPSWEKKIWKDSLNSNGQQFNQRQTTFHIKSTIEHKRITTYSDGNQGHVLGETLKCSGVKHLLEVVFPYSLISLLSQTAFTLHVVICKIKIKCHLHFLKNASIHLYVQLHYRIKAHDLKQRFNYTLLCMQRK
jgi:hypothetical protein